MTKPDECLELVGSQGRRSHHNAIINIACGEDVSAFAMRGAGARETGVLDAGGWFDAGAEQPDDRVHCPLGAQSRGSVAERHCGIKVSAAIPTNSEEGSLAEVNSEPPVPPREIQLKHLDFFAGVPDPALPNEFNDGFCCRKRDFPLFSAMKMG